MRLAKVVLVGSPNVGKSVIFNYLTGQYVTVSNYPGTTVDIARGHCKINGKIYEVIDTPGIYSLIPITEEERVTRQLLYQEKADVIIHVIDGKNIRRMLPLTLQLIEAGFPVILTINLMDEVKKYGIFINTVTLAKMLGITIIETSAVKKVGVGNLKQAIGQYCRPAVSFHTEFSNEIEQSIHRIANHLTVDYRIPPRMAAILLLQGDEIVHTLACKEPFLSDILREIEEITVSYEHNMEYVLAVEGQTIVNNICNTILRYKGTCQRGFMEKLGEITREPLSGIPILCLVLFLGLYEFVGKFGAGFLVDYIDTAVFSQYINPIVEHTTYQYIPWEWLQSLIVGKYGIFTLGFRYAFVIILPIVGTFFLMFAILEDSGYLPRLAMLVDKVFKYLGLNGRAVIPFALGLGCGTMAVMVTRTLETRRERILATFLLSLTIPCSAQLGVILALLSHSTLSLTIWGLYIGIIFAVVGWLSGKVLPGESSAFYMEIPPLRLPLMSNVLSKACIRMWWYFVEILPVFVITSLIIWSADRFGLLIYIIKCVEPAMTLLGLPEETAQAFILGFFRRDYGAAGLYDMCANNVLTTKQLLIASVTLTLFMPCIAQVAVMIKERGLFLSAIMILIIVCMAFFSGWLLYWLLDYWQITIS